MLRYALRRLLLTIPTLFVIVTLAFFVMRLAPGGPFDQEQMLPPDVTANLEAAYGLDQPMWVQYGRYLGGPHGRQPHQCGLRAFGLGAACDGAVGLGLRDHAVLAQPFDQMAPVHRAAVGRDLRGGPGGHAAALHGRPHAAKGAIRRQCRMPAIIFPVP